MSDVLAWTLLIQGKILEALISVYTTPLGEIFYFLLIFLFMTMVYLKTQSIGYMALVMLLMSGMAVPYVKVGTHRFILFFLIALGLAMIFYKVLKK